MFTSLKPSTRLAFQALTALSLVLVLSYFLPLQRSYWALVTAILLISQTVGESLRKAFQRTVMTIFGGIVGSTIYFLSHGNVSICLLFTIISVFFLFYYFETSYLIAIFFLTMLVVFLFALINAWTIDLLAERIYETALGAVIAVFVSAFVFPIRASHVFERNLLDFLKALEEFVHKVYEVPFEVSHDRHLVNQAHAELIIAYLQLKKNERIRNVESILQGNKQDKFTILSDRIYPLLLYALTAMQTGIMLPAQSMTGVFFEALKKSKQNVLTNFEGLVGYLHENSPTILFDKDEGSLSNFAAGLTLASKEDVMNMRAYLYCLSEFSLTLQRMADVLKSKQNVLSSAANSA